VGSRRLVIDTGGLIQLVAGNERARAFLDHASRAVTVRTGDFSGLRHLKRAAGENFVCGVILHAGRRSLSFGDGMWAVPIAALWS